MTFLSHQWGNEVPEVSCVVISLRNILSVLVQHDSQGPDWLIPILFRVRKANCSTNFQTSVALTNKNVFLTYPVTNAEVPSELAVFLPPKDAGLGLAAFRWTLCLQLQICEERECGGPHGEFSWAWIRSGARNFCHVLLAGTQSCGVP